MITVKTKHYASYIYEDEIEIFTVEIYLKRQTVPVRNKQFISIREARAYINKFLKNPLTCK